MFGNAVDRTKYMIDTQLTEDAQYNMSIFGREKCKNGFCPKQIIKWSMDKPKPKEEVGASSCGATSDKYVFRKNGYNIIFQSKVLAIRECVTEKAKVRLP